ncbi:hypothetical protein A2773_06280 [Candidatus Gottesmanbacteria bacterium RIFCSPHIGHO2_01_FULL_39_10]|uniref:DDH domain-containing protein n=1 Tax=Candidatus Gottesmanbacteria bacterium RIFCSPHIGHO2_01_FULL_39_10 TaxID=1798375 RepID=A0A1F5ZMS3_9BACT|nr:MAG: hypothetical protein A2773_06280 [Candidatus Gottesmanbacteria bacterium RIFCSPHIGHO2_01_FULL_39_10]
MQNSQNKGASDIKSVIDNSREILIATPRNPSMDSTASALSLYLSLSTLGKHVSVVSPSPMTVEFNQLVGVDKILNMVSNGGRNLVVSFPYQEGSIEKVSYNIENDVFHLVIEPREGYPTITAEKLSYSYGGGSFDTIIAIGASNLYDLDAIYNQNQSLFSEKQLINIDNNPANNRFGKVNIVDPNLASISEMVVNMISSLGVKIDPDIATNLLAGITSGSNNFTSPRSNGMTFEAAAICMRNGARKLGENVQNAQPYQFPTTQYNQQPAYQAPVQPQSSPMPSYQQPAPRPMQQPQVQQPRPQQFRPQQPRMQQRPQPQPIPQPQQNQQGLPQKKKPEAPPDWLKPKIYKGSTLL